MGYLMKKYFFCDIIYIVQKERYKNNGYKK